MSKKNKIPLRVLITAGPTRAYLDEVRFLSNYSTGELGYLTARELLRRGVEVLAVVGPTNFEFEKLKGIHLTRVETADDMYDAVLKLTRKYRPQFAVFAAAVLDFAPAFKVKGKVSSQKKSWTLKLVPTPKIIDAVGKEFPKVKRIGFKLECNKMTLPKAIQFAQANIEKKRLDALCLNFLSAINAKQHPAILMKKSGAYQVLKTKTEIAKHISKVVL